MATREEIIASSPFKPVPKKIIKYIRESPDSFTIRLDWQMNHDPGQFVFCSLPGIGEAPISICSHSKEYVDLNIREVGNVTNKLGELKEGMELLVRGPYGVGYPVDVFKNKNVTVVGGGCGVAPLKGVIDYMAANTGEFNKIDLYLGFRTPEDTLFETDVNTWISNLDVQVSYDNKPAHMPCTLDSTEGFVTKLVEAGVNHNDNAMAILCGPPIMIDIVVKMLKEKGFTDEQIYLSAERLMYCGIGKCGRCMIHGRYTCLDGPVFRYDKLKEEVNDD